MALRNKRIKVGLLFGAAVVLLGMGAGGAFLRPAQEPDQVIAARFGDVAWNHELHARHKEIQSCQVCHHKERPGTTTPKPCRDCHKAQSNQDAVVLADLHMPLEKVEYKDDHGPPPMTAFHGRCVGCHKAMKQGPVVCRDCHTQKFVGSHGRVEWDHLAHARRIDMGAGSEPGAQCRHCHHQDKHAVTDADYRPCGACHEPAAAAALEVKTGTKFHEKLAHGDCKRCHTVVNPEEGSRTCKDCHKGWNVDTKVQRPAIEQAVHQRCLECHNADYAGLTPGMPVRCDECHRADQSTLADLDVGLVLWDHDRHAKYGEGMRCDKCHHADKPDQPHVACSRCHGTGLYQNPPVAEALHKRCIGCHTEKANGLVSWAKIDSGRQQLEWHVYQAAEGTLRWNHREHAVAWSFSCRNCHHGLLRKDGDFVTAGKVAPEEREKATQIQACGTCHGESGPVPGSPAAGTKAPALDGAMKKVCLECHQRLGGGPQQWAEYFQVEPVEKMSAAAPRAEEQTR